MGRQKGLFGVGTLSVVFTLLLKVLVHNFADKTVEEPFVCAAAVENEGTPRAQTASAEPPKHQPPNQSMGKRQICVPRDSAVGCGTGNWCPRQAPRWLQADSST